ncbi:hypothetical protein [Geobacillus stearothermophilus]|uniref:hypothetical protein n=1 Tax=Geobacillus stearothermophilus TaxID=1422 RepID=UPI002E206BA1|nr:hypothetical protein [Geobacillus stearothermophilus]MED3740131.1 hypothetical protein [Geobacillus stearothermophilus]MED3765986.1 hypothetical protein [Geobacillus stearothermophilus]MED3773713.1 hypothetical protein [Geobacillus stearothermophilus]
MATLTKVSPYRSGPPRFGNRPHNIDTSVKKYQLTPEQLERYRNGESIDDILKGEEHEVAKKIDLTVEEYIDLRRQGFSDAVIAAIKNITKQQLYNWKSFRKEKIAQLEEELEQQQNESQETVKNEPADSETITEDAGEDAGIERLKREAIHARKLLAEKEQECERLRQEVEHYKELFETAMEDKERLHKETIILENEIQRLKELVNELRERKDQSEENWADATRELRALRLYALQKLQKDVYDE